MESISPVSNADSPSVAPPVGAARDDLKVCSECWCALPLSDFHERSNGKGVRPSCKECTRENRRLSAQPRAKSRRSSLRTTLTEIRRSRTTRRVANLIEAIAEKLGGVDAFVNRMREFLDPDIPLLSRLRVHATIQHMLELVDKDREREQSCSVHDLHRQGLLLPALRAMWASGELTIDDVDPPPAG